MLDTLTSDEAAVGRNNMMALFERIVADPDDDTESAATRAANAMKSPYFNALQVKYGYSLTCHKAQGGQWAHVYVDLGYIPAEAMGMEFYRWLYTAVTRATQKLFLINPSVEVK